jgi:tetratricopeptide (TPR) repeat protein
VRALLRKSVLYCVVVAASAPAVALGQDLPAALALEGEGRLGDALDAFARALEQPGSSQEDLATIYLHLSMLRFGTGDRAGALQALNRLLALDRDVELPASAPPEIRDMLREAASVWGERRFGATVEAPDQASPGVDAVVRLTVVDDVAGIVGGAALVVGADEVIRESGRGPSFEIAVPAASLAGGGVVVTPRLLDEHDGIVWQGDPVRISVGAGAGVAEDEGSSAATPPASRPGRRALRIAGWTLLGAGLAAACAGGVLVGIDGTVIEERQVEGRLQERRYTTAVAGWALVGAAGAGLVAAVVLLVLGYRGRAAAAAALRIAGGEIVQW